MEIMAYFLLMLRVNNADFVTLLWKLN